MLTGEAAPARDELENQEKLFLWQT